VYAAAAQTLAAAGRAGVVLGATAPPGASPAIRWPGRVAPAEVAALLPAAELVITNGGAALVQALASGRPVLAAPVAADQARRIARALAAGALAEAPLEPDALARAALSLLEAPAAAQRLAAGARALGLINGLTTALAAFDGLLRPQPSTILASRRS
jgi:UDP:flavonoid glycosyltransferase YjiC (YdhE family)